MTIRSKLILLYSGLLAVIIVAFGIVLFAVTRWVLVSSVDNTLAATADQIWRNSHAEEIGEFGGPSQIVIWLPANLDFFRASGVVVQVWQLGDDQPVLKRASSNMGSYTDPLDSGALAREQQSFKNDDTSLPRLYTTVRINSGDWRVLTIPNDIYGWRVVIQAATSFDSVNQASQGLVVIIIIGTTIALIGSMVLGFWLTTRALKPIEDITRSAAQITAADDLKTRLSWNGPMDELGELVSVFNGAMERLQHLFNVQQRFVADVSHELRTPLTAITGNVELIKRYGMDTESLNAIEARRTACRGWSTTCCCWRAPITAN
ncbi:MAG: histidine kinase dimerization/phospho-acceptor domain-containing protein [Anaerolineae bacterium]